MNAMDLHRCGCATVMETSTTIERTTTQSSTTIAEKVNLEILSVTTLHPNDRL